MTFSWLNNIWCLHDLIDNDCPSLKSSMTQKPGLCKRVPVYITFLWDFKVCFSKKSSQWDPVQQQKNLTVLPLWTHPKAFCALIENRIAPVPSDSLPQRGEVQDCQSHSLWNSFSCFSSQTEGAEEISSALTPLTPCSN